MVAEAQRSRAPIQRVADRVAAWFVPAVIVIAVAAFVVWATVGPEPRLAHALIVAVVRPDHRLPLCAGAGHAHVDHGGRRPRCRPGRPDQERRGARGDGEGRHPGGRQDGHPHRGKALGHRGRPCRRARRERAAPPRRRGRTRVRAPPGCGSRQRGRGRRAARPGRHRLRLPDRQGRHRNGGGPAGPARQRRLHVRTRDRGRPAGDRG